MARPGGVRRDLDAEAQEVLTRRLGELEPAIRAFVDALLDAESFMDRLAGTGVLGHDVAESLGAVGVAARASGVARDVRHDRPYAAYAPGVVAPITRADGDVRARMLVRIDEVFASFALIRRFVGELAEIAPGELVVPVGPLPPESWAMSAVESPRGEDVHWVMTGREGEIYRYRVRSASYNWALVPFAVVGNLLPDFPLINKSFELCYACLDR
jgi:Ni,Fe-hydrogenase III large subunit